MVFSTKIREIFWGGRGTAHFTDPSPDPSPVGRGIVLPTLTPLGACGTSTPPILKFWVRHWLTYSGDSTKNAKKTSHIRVQYVTHISDLMHETNNNIGDMNVVVVKKLFTTLR